MALKSSAYWKTSQDSSGVDKMKGQILCLVGPPGVGKTSACTFDRIGSGAGSLSVFRWWCETRRKFAGIRLKSYIGSMPEDYSKKFMRKPGVPLKPVTPLD